MRLILALLVAIPLAVAQPALGRAGTIGDAVVGFGGWLSKIENSATTWASGFWRGLGEQDGDKVSTLFRRMAFEQPARLSDIAKMVGFVLSEYRIDGKATNTLVLRFGFNRALDEGERMALMRHLLREGDRIEKPELKLIRILLDASDWHASGPRAGGFELVGVDVTVDNGVNSQMVFGRATTKG
ncbi:MAG: hypothetical protein HOH65_05500 [Rhodospirillaceae bacterium]|jgi:hypothetical protein|nr:hypothetical protein [Rhodospirillaceae bacterium]